jgi:hypothetical protein
MSFWVFLNNYLIFLIISFFKNQKNGLNNAIDFKIYMNKIILHLYLAIYIGCIWLNNKPYQDLKCCKNSFQRIGKKQTFFLGPSCWFCIHLGFYYS